MRESWQHEELLFTFAKATMQVDACAPGVSGFMMTHIESGQNQYFYPGRNQTLLEQPFRVSHSSDITTLIQQLKDKDILQHVHQQRPNTKWKLTHITNVLYISYNLRHVIGTNVILPHRERVEMGRGRAPPGVPWICVIELLTKNDPALSGYC